MAKEFFEYHVPNNILKAADLNSLHLQKSSFIDEHLKASMANILYSVKLNCRPGYFYIIVEHRRNPDKLNALPSLMIYPSYY
ncbi:Rpn family recombination-promoting nuclease/putative transposase [Coxiella endosymbiont of Ornithodoros maritimus]|uniref:Rpn family recombination-promoting nuclease/putative transposase n=1 Tax=Coxiella endosymbiont of Ornithodoros maritimus TaxID=1656172 RepID=UPI00226545F2|nr:Rpn family recombination-promoting nuclease/putative transposase [Coxiella endosymbiont of Ornithodoros maritimus]